MFPSPISSFILRRSSFRPFTAIVLLLIIVSCIAATDTAPSTAPSDITFETTTIQLNGKPFTLEIADTEIKRERGLMFRKSMPADRGMVFIFDHADKYAFWMKDTELPLDLLFLDAAGKIILIAPLKPYDETNVAPESPASFAVELNKDAVKAFHLHLGDTFPLPDKLLKPAAHPVEK